MHAVRVLRWLTFEIKLKMTSLSLANSFNCFNAGKTTLKNMGKFIAWILIDGISSRNDKNKNKPCTYFIGFHWRYSVNLLIQKKLPIHSAAILSEASFLYIMFHVVYIFSFLPVILS